jgi:tetratricopeptide (TPR) repeat protein
MTSSFVVKISFMKIAYTLKSSDWPLPSSAQLFAEQNAAEQLFLHADKSGRLTANYSELVEEPRNIPALGSGSILTFRSQPVQLNFRTIHTIIVEASPVRIEIWVDEVAILSDQEAGGKSILIPDTELTIEEAVPNYQEVVQKGVEKISKLSIEDLAELVRLQPENAPALYNYATALAMAGEHAKARPYYEKARFYYPQYAYIHSNLASSLMKLGELDLAYESLKESLEIDSDNAVAHNAMGILLGDEEYLAKLGKFNEAKYHFEESIRLDAIDIQPRLNYAILLSNRFPNSEEIIHQQLSFVFVSINYDRYLLREAANYLQRGVVSESQIILLDWASKFFEQADALIIR